MSADPKTPSEESIQLSDAIFSLAYGSKANPLPATTDEIKQELRDDGIDPEASWEKTKKLLNVSAGRLKLETARRQRLAATAKLASSSRSTFTETRESIIDQIRRLLLAEPTAAVYARKWEDGDLDTLISLRDKLSSTSARDLARKNAS